MDWITVARQRFAVEKPAHFTDYTHCCECAEHDQTLLDSSIDRIGLAELGNPGWDPLCFCNAEGIAYYFPALVRMSLETADDDAFYFEQLLFHLGYGGPDNRFLKYCSDTQRDFVARFVEHMIGEHAARIDDYLCTDEALAVHRLWSDG